MFETPENFMLLAQMDPDNRWIQMAKLIPWDLVEEKYAKKFKNTPFSRPAKPARMAIGSLIIKEKYGLSDVETVEMIAENPYMQHFIGLESFSHKAPMEASLLTWFRKRISADMLAEINDYVIGRKVIEEKRNDPPDDIPPSNGNSGHGDSENKGTLILDATCVPSDIRFPTDVSLLNESRECLEDMVDELHESGMTNSVKPRTYRQVARKEYLRFVRNRKPTIKLIRKAIKRQLGYIRRDLITIESCGVDHLSTKSQERLAVICSLYGQQQKMYEAKSHQVQDRIVSIHQPWVRPIVRGKARADVEFGAKVSVSVVEGYMRIERLSWDPYNESTTLAQTLERFKEQTGFYPQRILADKIYRTRENLQYCAKRHVRMSGPHLGRPPKDKSLYAQQCADERREAGERNEVEGGFGTGKRCFGLDRLTARLQATCETQIHVIVLTMNLFKRLRRFLRRLFNLIYELVWNPFSPWMIAVGL